MKSVIRTTITGKFQRGVTLMELMVVVVIIGILAAIAYPSYIQFTIKGHRAAAQSEMMDIANREQQYLLANRAYANQSTLGYTLPTKISTRYTYAVTVDAGPSFTITFTAIGSQASDGNLTLNNAGVKTPASKW